MKKIKKDNLEKILCGYLILALLTIFVSSVMTTYRFFDLERYSFIVYGLGILGFIMLIYTIIKNRYTINKIDVVVILLTVFGIISVIFSKDPQISLLGRVGRYEGLYMILTYYIMFQISTIIKNKKLKEIIINTILILGSICVFYGLLQITDYTGTIMNSWLYAKSFMGNSIFFSSYNILCLGLALGIYLFGSKEKKYYLIYILIFSIGLFSTGSMSGLVGLIMMLIGIFIFIIYFIKKKKIESKPILKKSVFVVISIILSYCFISLIGRGHYSDDVKEVVNQAVSIVQNKSDDSFGTERLYIWKNTLKYVPKYILHGVGIDMFMSISPEPLILPISRSAVDKAHNEYLQILATEGIFALITYLTLLFMVFFNSLKRIFKNPNKNVLIIGLFLAFFGYIAQAFFNISVCRVAPIFYIVMGLLYNRYKEEN